jgi:acyl dehydratase
MRDVQIGTALPTRDFTITRADLRAYAEASGDHNPIHQDEAFALSVGLPGIIAHGMVTMGLVARTLEEWGGAGSVRDIGVRFTRPVVVADQGAVITIAGAVSSVDTDDDGHRIAGIDVTATFNGQTVLSRARATVRLV